MGGRLQEEHQDKIYLWDKFVRFFHWAIVISVFMAWWSINNGNTDLHLICGITTGVLVILRIIWGFVGSKYARFTQFVKGPKSVLNSAKTFLKKDEKDSIGHNPMGALSILALLFFLFLQFITGMFSDDDILFAGPLAELVSYDTRILITKIHKLSFEVLKYLIFLHIFVIFFYWIYKGKNLIWPMIVGWKKTNKKNPS